MKKYLSWEDFRIAVDAIAVRFKCNKYKGVYGIPRGGLIMSVMLSHKLGIPHLTELPSMRGRRFLVVDDIADTGYTLEHTMGLDVCAHADSATIHYHKDSSFKPDYHVMEKGNDWIVYPWECCEEDEIQDYKR
jgi:xanthine phosphoribosyltransferase